MNIQIIRRISIFHLIEEFITKLGYCDKVDNYTYLNLFEKYRYKRDLTDKDIYELAKGIVEYTSDFDVNESNDIEFIMESILYLVSFTVYIDN